jgi:hypothetical protein
MAIIESLHPVPVYKENPGCFAFGFHANLARSEKIETGSGLV